MRKRNYWNLKVLIAIELKYDLDKTPSHTNRGNR